MSEPMNTRPTAESQIVHLTPRGVRSVRRSAMAITLGSFLFGFDTGIISGALLFIREEFGLSSFEQSSVVSVLLLGAIAGALTSGRLADRYGRRPLLAGLGVLFTLGIIVAALAHGYWMMMLGRIIMGEAGLSASKAIYYSVAIGVINVAITVVSLFLVDRLGRRPLLLGSLAGMAVSIAMLGVAFAADLDPLVMLVFMLLYIVAFGIGMGPVFWVLLGEIFPPAQQAEGSSAGATVNWLSNFVVSLLFLPMISAIGQAPTFYVFAGVCVLGVLFVAKWVPETRGRDADEVGADLHRRWNVTST